MSIRAAILTAVLIVWNHEAAATVRTTLASGAYEDQTTWSGGQVPATTDSVIVAALHTVTLSASTICARLEIRGSLVFLASGGTAPTLTVQGTFLQQSGALHLGTGGLEVEGDFVHNAGTFDATNGTTRLVTNQEQRLDGGTTGVLFGALEVAGTGSTLIVTSHAIATTGDLSVTSQLGLDAAIATTIVVGGNLLYAGVPGGAHLDLVTVKLTNPSGLILPDNLVAGNAAHPAVVESFATARVHWRTDPSRARPAGPAGADGKVPIVLENTFERRRRDVDRLFAGSDRHARLVLDLDDRTLVRNPSIPVLRRGPAVDLDLNVEVVTGAAYELASNVDIVAGRAVTVKGSLHCETFSIGGDGDVTVTSTGRLGTKTLDPAGLGATLVNAGTNTFVDAIVDYEAAGSQTVHAAAHPGAAMIYTSGSGTKTLDGDLELTGNSGSALVKGALRVAGTSTFADDGHRLAFTTAGFANVVVDPGGTFESSPGGAIVYGPGAVGSGLRAANGTRFGDLELRFNAASNAVRLYAGGASDIAVQFRTVRFLGTAGGTLRLSQAPDLGATNVTVTDSVLIAPEAVSSSGGGFGGATGKTSRITVLGDLVSHSTNPIQAIFDATGTNRLVMQGAARQSLHFDTGASIFNGSTLALDNASGVELAGAGPKTVSILGTLRFDAGNFDTGADVLFVPGTVTGTGGFVVGRLQKTVPTGTSNRAFEVGPDAARPLALRTIGAAPGGTVTVQTVSGIQDLAGSGLEDASAVQRRWTISSSGVRFTSAELTLPFANPSDLRDPAADPAGFVVARHDASGWLLLPPDAATGTDQTKATGIRAFGDFFVGATCPVITLTPVSLPGAAKGQTYAGDPITAAGGAAGYVFTVASGALPPGLNLGAQGAWSGAATVVGDFAFTVRAEDANGCTGERAYTLAVGPAPVTALATGSATPGDRQVTLRWINPVDPDVQNVVIRFAAGTPLGASPTEGQFLTRLDFRDSVFVHHPSANGTAQFYNIFTVDRTARPSTVLQLAATPADTLHPGPVTSPLAQAGDGFVQLAWVNPPDPDFERTRLEFTATPSDSTSWAPVNSPGDFPAAPGSTGSFRQLNLVNETTYRYRWIALDDDDLQSAAASLDATPRDVTPPGPVPSLTATPLAAGAALQIVWTLPRDADLNRVVLRRSTLGFPADPTAGEAVGTGEFLPAVTSVVDSGLANGGRVFYSIWARDEVPGNFSEPTHATGIPADVQPPDPLAPGSFVATSRDTGVDLAWTGVPSSDFKGTHVRSSTDAPPTSPVQGLPVPNGSNGDFPRNAANTYAFSHPGLVNGVRVYYAAFSFDTARNFSQPRQASAIPADVDAPPPAAILRTRAGDRAVTLTLVTPSGTAANDLRGITVVVSTTGFPADERGGTIVARLDAGPGETHEVLHSGLQNGTTYFYSAFSFDEVPNYSRPAAQASATAADAGPPQPLTFFDAERGDESVRIVWTNPPDADFNHTRIEFETARSPGFQPVPNDSNGVFQAPPGAVRSFLHRSLLNGGLYRYRAVAVDDDSHDSAPPDTAAAIPRDTTPPDPMRAFTATPLAEGKKVALAWTVPANAAADSFFAVINVSTRGNPVDPTDGTRIGDFGRQVTAALDSGRANGIPLFYAIWGRDEAGNLSQPSYATATPRDIVPPPRLDGFFAQRSDGSVLLRWVLPTPRGDFARTHLRFSTVAPPATQRDGAPVPNTAGGFFPAGVTAFPHPGLTNGGRVFYSAFAVDADSNFASPLQATAVPADTIPTAAVAGLSAAPDFASVRLTWTNPIDTDFRGVLIRFTDSTAVGCPGARRGSLVARVLAEPGTASSFVHRPLQNETRYFYSVTAFDDEAGPNLAAPACALAVAGDHVPPDSLPSFVAEPAPDTITLTWINPPDADFAFTKIVFTNDHFVSTPDDSTANPVPNAANDGVFTGQPDSTVTFVHRGVAPGTSYFYSAFTFDTYVVNGAHPNGSAAATVSARVLDGVPPAVVTAFQARAVTRPGQPHDLLDDAVDIELQWTPPPAGNGPADDLAGVLIRFSSTEPPQTPSGGLPFPNGNDGRFTPQIHAVTHPSLVPGVRYFYSAFAFDTNPQPNYSPPQFQSATPATQTDSIPLAIARNGKEFPRPGLYQLVSVPYDVEAETSASLHLPDIFGRLGEPGRDWRGFSWTGIDSTGQVIQTENPVFRSGRGYWLIARKSLVSQYLETAAGQKQIGRRSSAPRLQLEEGWNIVGAPLVAPPGRLGADSAVVRGEDVRIVLPASGRSLTLAEARDARIIDGVFYRFNERGPSMQNSPGAYTPEPVDGAVLRAWRGRLLYAYQTCELCYYCGLLPNEQSSPKPARDEVPDWQFDVIASSVGRDDDAVRIGTAPGASSGWDRLDHPKPPAPDEGLTVAIDHPAWNRIPVPYAQSIDGPGDGDHRWALRVRGAADRVRIAWPDVSSLPPGWSAYLVLPVGAAVPMEHGTNFETPVANGVATFEVLVTRATWSGPVVRSGDSGLLPLHGVQRIGGIRLAYQALEPGLADLRVYDVRGRLVRNWGPMSGGVGTHELRWDGRSNAGGRIASGVYVVDLRLGPQRSTSKLVLLR